MEKIVNNIKTFLSNHIYLRKLIIGFLLFIIIWVSYDILVPLGQYMNDSDNTIRTVMIVIVGTCLCIGIYKKAKGSLSFNSLITLILIAGFALRIGYAFYTQAATRQHDVEMYSSGSLNINGQGHFAYIYKIYSTWQLPDSYNWQFYHPPLWHFLVALWMHIYELFHQGAPIADLFNAGMILSSFVGCLTLYFFKELIYRFSKNEKINTIALFILAFHPQFFIMAGWMNNEGLSLMFSVMALLYGIKFHQERKWSNIILCAISLGLGMMSKYSSALISLPLAFIFIYDLVIDIKNKKTRTILLQGISFITIAGLLGLWYIVRNITKFGIESISVPAISSTSSLSVSAYSYFDRFVLIPFWKIGEGIFCILRPNSNGYIDYNIWMYTLKCSVFGEYSYWGGGMFAVILYASNVILCIFSLFAIIYVFIKEFKTEERFNNIILLIIHLMSILSYIYFQIKYPVTCTEDFRYMTLILLPGAYFISKYLSRENDKKWVKRVNYSLLIVIGIFALSAVCFYCTAR
jgi:4-amino-4-deoxy-L-arabinose transferase-like glycosyltransferase